MGVHRTTSCGEPDEIKKNTHTKISLLYSVGRYLPNAILAGNEASKTNGNRMLRSGGYSS